MISRDRVTPRTRVATHVLLVVTSLTMVAPFLWMALTSFKTDRDIANFPPTWLPSSWRVANYTDALSVAPFDVYFRNSLIISIGHVVLNLVFASLAGYALARYRFRGREAVFLGFVALLMIPTYTKIVPQFLIAKTMPLFGGNDIFGYGGSGWVNTWWGLIIPGAVTPFAVFLFRQFYLSVPHELEDAARIDGCGTFGVFWRVILPLAKPALATLTIFTLLGSWNDLIWPLVAISDQRSYTIQLGLANFQGTRHTQWSLLMSGNVVATMPLIIAFLLLQRQFVATMTFSGLKG